MPERPSIRPAVGWGETAVQPEPTAAMIKENPWWQAVKIWKETGVRGHEVKQKMIFAGGLPRSGTTLLEIFLRTHQRNSNLEFSKEDDMHEGLPLLEGNWRKYGGSTHAYQYMCKIDDETGDLSGPAVMTEEDDVEGFRRAAWEGWQSWNFSKPRLVVKDPPNLLRMRLVQKAFSDTHDVFAIFTLMHPLEIGSRFSCNPKSISRQNIVKRWLNCHNRWLEDLKELKNYLVIPFEAWFKYPIFTGRAVEAFLNMKTHTRVNMPHRRLALARLRGFERRLVFHGHDFVLSRKYFARCRSSRSVEDYQNLPYADLAKSYTSFGYDLADSRRITTPAAFEPCVLDGIPCRSLK